MNDERKPEKVHMASCKSDDACDAEIAEALAALSQIFPTRKGVSAKEQADVLKRFKRKMGGANQ